MFKINDLSFSFKEDYPLILDNINLELPSQRCIGLLGENGSGKSTLAYSLVGIIPEIYKGSLKGKFIYKENNLLNESLQRRLNFLSYTFQDTESQILFGTVADIIGLNERTFDRESILRIVEILGIENLLSRPVNELSGGESQRVILTASLRNNPKLLLYDEATSALDPVVKRDFKKFVSVLLKENKTVLLLGQKYTNLSLYSSVNYVLSDAKIKLYEEKTETNNLEKEIDFWKEISFQTSQATGININEIFYAPKSSSRFVLNIKNLSVDKGRNIALVGLNGAGKSTLLNVIGGLVKADRFKTDLPNVFSQTRLVFQSPTSQLIGANIKEELNAADKSSGQKEHLILNHFPFLDFTRDPLDLSFGQQKVLCLLSAFLSERMILLIDEPELGVDTNNLNYIKAFLRLNQVKRQKTIIFSTHDLELATEFADECVLIDKGSIRFVSDSKNQNEIEDWFL